MKNLSAVKLLVLSVVLIASALLVKEAKAANAPCTIIGIPCSADMFFQKSTVSQSKVLGASTVAINCSLFTRNLKLGSTGADVTALQNFLIQKGYLVVPPGASLGYFGSQTRAALARYQAARRIRPVDGYFGPITRQAVIADCSSVATTPTTPDMIPPLNPLPSPQVATTTPTITVTSPNGGEVWQLNQSNLINWTGVGGDVVYAYLNYYDGGMCYVGSTSPDVGHITVPANYVCPNIPRSLSAGQYKASLILNRAGDNSDLGLAHDNSDGYFTISTTTISTTIDPNSTCANTALSRNLTIGSMGNDVVALQNFLKAKGYLVLPADATLGYFGAQTRAALAAYQVSKGISPADGYFGPLTRAIVTADCVKPSILMSLSGGSSYNVGDTVGYSWSANYPIKVPYGYLYNSSGAVVSSKMLAVTSKGSDSFLMASSTIPAGQYKIKVCDQGTDIINPLCGTSPNFIVNNIVIKPTPGTLKVISPNGGGHYQKGDVITIAWEQTGTNNPVYIDWIQDRDGVASYEMVTGLFGSMPQSPTGSLSWTIPSFIFGNDSAAVKNKIRAYTSFGNESITDESDEPFSVGSSTLPVIASTTASLLVNGQRSVTVNVGDTVKYDWNSTGGETYSSSYAKIGSGSNCPSGGAWAIYNASGTISSVIPPELSGCAYNIIYIVKNALTNKTASASITVSVNTQVVPLPSVTLTASANPIPSQTYTINNVDGNQGVPLVNFNLKSETADAQILSIDTSTISTGTPPSTLYLYQGSTLLRSKVYSSSGVVFDALDTSSGSIVPVNTIQTYTVKADFPTNTVNNTFARTTVNSATYRRGTSTATATGSAVLGSNQYLNTASAVFALTSAPTIAISGTSQTGTSLAMNATFNFNVTALGGTMIQPANTDFTVKFATSSLGSQLAASSVSVVTIPNNNIADGSTSAVTVTAQISAANVPASGLYNAYISNIRWTVGANTVNQSYGLENYKTLAAANFVVAPPAPTAIFALSSTPTIQITGTSPAGTSTGMNASFSFNVTAQGGDMIQPVWSDFTVKFATSTYGQQIAAQSVSVVTIPNNNIANGSTASVTVSVYIPGASVPASGLYNAYISSIKWKVGNNAVTQDSGLENYKTAAAANFVRVAPASATLTLVTPPTIQTNTSQTGSSTAMTATYQFNMSASGGTVLRPSSTDFGIKFATSSVGAQLSPSSVSVVTIPNGDIAAGNTASITVTAQIPSYLVPGSGLYYAYISSLRWTVGGVVSNQSPSLETYKTPAATNFIK